MIYYKEILLPDGRQCILRSPEQEDAPEMLEMLIKNCGETPHLARYPDEIRLTVEGEMEYIADMAGGPRSVLIAAQVDGRLVGSGSLCPASPFEKVLHRGEFGVAIRKSHWGLGVASAILTAILEVAREADYHQVELDVVASNRRAVELYERHGFRICGTTPRGFRLRDGHYEDHHRMVAILVE